MRMSGNSLFWAACLLTWPIFAQQTPTLSLSGPSTARSGQEITIGLSLNGVGAGTTATAQWRFPTPVLVKVVKSTVSPATISVGKQLYSEGDLYILAAMNRNTLMPGLLVTYTIALPPEITGNLQFEIIEPIFVTASADTVPITVSGPLPIKILKAADLNDDGKVDIIDHLIGVDQSLGRAPCGSSDLNKDGKCNAYDLQIIANVAVDELEGK